MPQSGLGGGALRLTTQRTGVSCLSRCGTGRRGQYRHSGRVVRRVSTLYLVERTSHRRNGSFTVAKGGTRAGALLTLEVTAGYRAYTLEVGSGVALQEVCIGVYPLAPVGAAVAVGTAADAGAVHIVDVVVEDDLRDVDHVARACAAINDVQTEAGGVLLQREGCPVPTSVGGKAGRGGIVFVIRGINLHGGSTGGSGRAVTNGYVAVRACCGLCRTVDGDVGVSAACRYAGEETTVGKCAGVAVQTNLADAVDLVCGITTGGVVAVPTEVVEGQREGAGTGLGGVVYVRVGFCIVYIGKQRQFCNDHGLARLGEGLKTEPVALICGKVIEAVEQATPATVGGNHRHGYTAGTAAVGVTREDLEGRQRAALVANHYVRVGLQNGFRQTVDLEIRVVTR